MAPIIWGIVLKYREMLVGQRTQAINALRGHAAEFGVVAAKGTVKVTALLTELAADSAIPISARAMFNQMGTHIEALDQHVAALDDQLMTCTRPTRSADYWPRSQASVRLARSPWP